MHGVVPPLHTRLHSDIETMLAYRNNNNNNNNNNNVTCRVVRVTKITGSSSDDWIYYHLGYSLS
jgi:hypothetical protein